MTSIRTFLVIVLLATMTLTVFIAALRGYRSSMHEAELLFDRQLQEIAELLEGFPTDAATPDATVIPAQRDGNFAYQIWADDRLTRKSPNAPDTPIVPLSAGYRDYNFNEHRWRIYIHREAGGNRWIVVAERADIRFALAEDIILKAVTPIIIGLPLAGLLIWGVVGYGVRPLRRLATDLGLKAADDLSPLPTEQVPEELKQVIRSTNDLLARLSAAFEREKRFAADAAHELRTPISVLKVHLHNLRRDLPNDNPNVMRLADGIERMNHLVKQILALYRSTPDQFMANFTRIDLHMLARDAISQLYGAFAARNLQIELTGSDSLLTGDRFALETLLQNLLSNAQKYTPRGGRVRVTVEPAADSVVLQVEDSGPGIEPAEFERVFERFYRVGGDRHASEATGCGLGLAIVRHIAELHHATISLDRSPELHGLSVRVVFPQHQPGNAVHA